MHKYFYASGFIYHSPTNKILLQKQNNDNNRTLMMFGDKCVNGDEPSRIIEKTLKDLLKQAISSDSIYPIYDYIHDKLGAQFVFYIESDKITPDTHPTGTSYEWIPLAKIYKYDMSEKTRHDIVVGERVINLKKSDDQKAADDQPLQ